MHQQHLPFAVTCALGLRIKEPQTKVYKRKLFQPPMNSKLASGRPSAVPAILALEDGSVFHGVSLGVAGQTTGEVVFNTSMTGYQEIMTDPSYARQLVTFTYPHIGNTGINEDDVESRRIWVDGIIIRDEPLLASNWRNRKSLQAYLAEQNLVAIAGVDTRRLTRVLRDKGALRGCIVAGESIDESAAIEAARGVDGLAGRDLAASVSRTERCSWSEGLWTLDGPQQISTEGRFHVVAYDYGVKHNILRLMADRGCKVTLVPAKTPFEEAMSLHPDGIFLANGPGDPEPCDYAIEVARQAMAASVPLFGICLGHQILALASGAKTFKMKFGHHGANHPVQDLATGQVQITSQNHGFSVDEASLPANLVPTHKSLFDGSLQGVARTDVPAFSFQGHPEASPGPHDLIYLFDRFNDLMESKAPLVRI